MLFVYQYLIELIFILTGEYMKKILVATAIFGVCTFSFAQSVEKNFANLINEKFGVKIDVLSAYELKSIPSLYLVLTKDNVNGAYPFYVNKNGDSYLQVGEVFSFSNKDDEAMLKSVFEKMQVINDEIKNARIDTLFDSLPKKSFITINSRAKTGKLITIVTDPDCPYCREELKNIRKHLEGANVRFVFASVHDETAFIKAQLILDEAKLISSFDADKIISIFEKYYKDIELSDKQKSTNYETITNSTETIFGSGLIKGVPYIHEGNIK